MKKYIVYIVLVVLMITSLFVSGLFFDNSGLVNYENGIDNEKSIQILTELDKLPLISIDAYKIIFHSYGELTEINGNRITIVLSGEKEIFIYEEDLSEFKKGDWLRVYYNYLPEGGKKVTKVERIDK